MTPVRRIASQPAHIPSERKTSFFHSICLASGEPGGPGTSSVRRSSPSLLSTMSWVFLPFRVGPMGPITISPLGVASISRHMLMAEEDSESPPELEHELPSSAVLRNPRIDNIHDPYAPTGTHFSPSQRVVVPVSHAVAGGVGKALPGRQGRCSTAASTRAKPPGSHAPERPRSRLGRTH